jgi:hypothetical protein
VVDRAHLERDAGFYVAVVIIMTACLTSVFLVFGAFDDHHKTNSIILL